MSEDNSSKFDFSAFLGQFLVSEIPPFHGNGNADSSQSSSSGEISSVSPTPSSPSLRYRRVSFAQAIGARYARARQDNRAIVTMEIPLAHITSSRIPNCRVSQSTEEDAELKESMARNGLINSVTVVRDDSKRSDEDKPELERFILICGFRRFAAAAALGWREIRATVIDDVRNAADALILNLAENIDRSDITTYAMAIRCEELISEHHLRVEDLAKALGRSQSYVYELLRHLQLPDAIVTAWSERHPLMTMKQLRHFSSLGDPQLCLAKWEKIRVRYDANDTHVVTPEEKLHAALADEPTEEEDGNSDGWNRFRRPTDAVLVRLRDTIGRQQLPADPTAQRVLIQYVIDYARGAASKIPGVLAPALPRRRPRKHSNGT